jgi:hypothetical protein
MAGATMSLALNVLARPGTGPEAGPGIGRRGGLAALVARLGAPAWLSRLAGGAAARQVGSADPAAGSSTSVVTMLRKLASDGAPSFNLPWVFDRLRPMVEATLHGLAEKAELDGAAPDIAASRARLADDLVLGVLRLVRKQAAADGKEASLTVVALGRYGQHRLDQDASVELLMLVLDHGRQRPASESLARQVVHGLGCLGLQLAASIMGPRECLAFARDEAAVQASLMGARYLGGSYGPWAKLQAELDAVLWGGPPAARPR